MAARTPARAREQRLIEQAVEDAARAGGPRLQRALAALPAGVRVEVLAEALSRLDADAAVEAAAAGGGEEMERAIMGVLVESLEASVARAGAATALIESPAVPERAARWAAEHGAALVADIDEQTRAGVRAAVARSLQAGAAPGRAARQIRALVGLTERQEATLARSRASLEARGNPPARVDATIARQAGALRAQRADLIVRTESVAAVARGRDALWDDIASSGAAGDARIVRIWLSARDARVDPICMTLDGKEVARGERFPGGFEAPPAHPACRCSVVVEART